MAMIHRFDFSNESYTACKLCLYFITVLSLSEFLKTHQLCLQVLLIFLPPDLFVLLMRLNYHPTVPLLITFH